MLKGLHFLPVSAKNFIFKNVCMWDSILEGHCLKGHLLEGHIIRFQPMCVCGLLENNKRTYNVIPTTEQLFNSVIIDWYPIFVILEAWAESAVPKSCWGTRISLPMIFENWKELLKIVSIFFKSQTSLVLLAAVLSASHISKGSQGSTAVHKDSIALSDEDMFIK